MIKVENSKNASWVIVLVIARYLLVTHTLDVDPDLDYKHVEDKFEYLAAETFAAAGEYSDNNKQIECPVLPPIAAIPMGDPYCFLKPQKSLTVTHRSDKCVMSVTLTRGFLPL